jgi:DNA-binding transcriptional regulator YhcF (GntR family)
MLPSSLQKQAYASIHLMILNNELSKGDVTSEIHLSQLLGMSRTPIRSALQRLEIEGFLRIIPKQGILILDQSAQKAGDLIDILASVILFTISSLRHSKYELLSSYIVDRKKSFAVIFSDQSTDSTEIVQVLCDMELDFFLNLIGLIHNEEMKLLFAQTANRLYWQSNTKRWNTLHFKTTMNGFQKLFQDILTAEKEVYEAIYPYIQLIKKTWT